MYKMAFQVTQLHIYYHRAYKNFGIGCMKVINEFKQCIYQKLGVSTSVFMQLPNFSENRLKNVSRNKQKYFSNFRNFIKMPKEERVDLLKSEFNDEEVAEIEEVVSALPDYDVFIFTMLGTNKKIC